MTDFIRENKKGILIGIVTALAGSFITVMLPLSLGNLQSIGSGEEGTKSRLLSELGLRVQNIDGFFLLFFTLVLLRFIAVSIEHYLSSRIASAWTQKLRDYLFERQLLQSPALFREKDAGYYLLRFTGDMSAAKNLVSKGLIKACADIGLMLFSLMVFAMMDFWLSVILVTVFMAGTPVSILLSRASNRRKSKTGNAKSSLIKTVSEAFNRFITIKALNFEKKEMRLFRKKSEMVYQSEKDNALVESIDRTFSETYFFLLVAAVVFFYYGKADSSVNNIELLTIILLLLYLRGPIRRTLSLPRILKTGKAALDKIAQIAERPIESAERNANVKKEARSISYHSNGTVPGNLVRDFHAERGKTTIITGIQGSGKSRILQKLVCLENPEAHESIFLNEVSYSELTPFAIRRQLAYSSQEIILSGNSIAEALRMNDSDELPGKALSLLNKLGFDAVELREQSCLTDPREIPGGLSSGQLQILRLTRAILTGKKVLCLDEPFAGLDSGHIRAVTSILNELRGSHTIIIACSEVPDELITDKKVILEPIK